MIGFGLKKIDQKKEYLNNLKKLRQELLAAKWEKIDDNWVKYVSNSGAEYCIVASELESFEEGVKRWTNPNFTGYRPKKKE